MNFEEFAEINEEFLSKTPTQMVKMADDINFNGEEKEAFNIWAMTYPKHGVGESGLIKRVSEFWDIDEYTLETMTEMHGGLPEAIYEFEQSHLGEEFSLDEVTTCLYAECRDMAYEHYMTMFPELSSLGRKWLTAFILRQTRNGTGETSTKKMIGKMYGFNASEIKKAVSFLSMPEFIEQAIDTGSLEVVPTAGRFMKPMLAKGGNFSVRTRRWCDYKYDGIRAQVHYDGKTIRIFNRRGDEITDKYERDLIPIIAAVTDPVDWIVDGEIYPVDTNGEPAIFNNMMSRIHGKTEDVIYRNAVTIRLFDCLMYGGQPVFEDNLDTRLETLKMHFGEELLAKTKEVNNQEEMLEYYEGALKAGFEGVIVKDPNATYDFGARSKAWMKLKAPVVEIDCEVTGATLGRGKRAGQYGAYDIAIRDGDDLVSFGSVGSGFTDEDLTFLHTKYTKMISSEEDITMIIEVKGDMITKNEKGEYGLRFPRYVKYREDKVKPTQLKEVLE